MRDRFLRACRREEVDRTPIWLMRQSGRYLPAYRKLRKTHTLLEICKTPKLAAAASLLPLKLFDLDAAIIFADIMLPLEGMGVSFRIEDATGPIIEKPLRNHDDSSRLKQFDPKEDTGYVLEAIRILKRKLKVPLIGFSGAPFTLASYIIEGGASRDFTKTKSIMFNKPDLWDEVMKRLTETVNLYLESQVEAGVDAVQLFDSWVGCLSPIDYREKVQRYSREVFKRISELSVPGIHFGTGTSSMLGLMSDAGGDVIGVDWRVPLDEAWRKIGHAAGIQGNLEPAVLIGHPTLVKKRAVEVLDRAGRRPGHIFNLGHGVIPATDPKNVSILVDAVHRYGTGSQ